MADISKRGPECDDGEHGERGERGERGEKGARGKRGKRGHHGHDGHDGATGPAGPFGPTGPSDSVIVDPVPPTLTGNGTEASPLQVINVASQPLFPLGTVITIYARIFGSDATGDGSLANPYRTLQHAVLDVPHIIPPNLRYVVDVTGLGLETLPQDYALPPILSATGPDFDFSGLGPAGLTTTVLPLIIYAEPQLLATIPPGDAAINPGDIASDVGDPNTGLRTLTLNAPRASWAGDALKGSFAIGSLNGNDNATIFESTSFTITYGSSVALTAPIRVMASSTTFTGSVSPEGFFRGVFTVTGSTQLQMLGISVVPPSGSGFVGLLSEKCELIVLRIGKFVDIDLEDMLMRPRSVYLLADSFGSFVARGNWAIQNSLIEGTFFSGSMFGDYTFRTSKFDGVERLGEITDFNAGVFPFMSPSFNVQRCLIVNSPGDAIVFHGSRGLLQRVTINDSAGNAVFADGGFLDMQRVQGVGNGGFGLRADEGALVRVDANTTVTGVSDLMSGDLPPATWAQ
ncbi:MAG: hypothetical protein IMZ46_11930, partial [Acidobacteria bacterium]|nr:hypothetical protein [Acidobacteriota bacterium]